MLNHRSMQVRCSLEQPIQVLVDKLASKSSDLYIFWQNYNQLYQAYNEKIIEIQRLQSQNETLRRQRVSAKPSGPPPEESFFKERFLFLEKHSEELKSELQRLRIENRELKKDNQRWHQENTHLQNVMQQLRDENSVQRMKIQKVLSQLKAAQGEINAMAKVYDQLGQKELILSKYVEREKELIVKIQDLESQLDARNEQELNNKARYERIVKESMISAKNKVIESLPAMVQASKQKVQIIAP